MDYKKIFKSRKLRYRMLKMLSFIPDKTMLKIQYRVKFGRWPDFKSPKRYTEKIQLYKLYYRNPILHTCVDKHAVKDYIRNLGLDIKVPKLYKVYDDAQKIDFSSLPDKFVIKTNDGSGGLNIILCNDKSKLDINSTIQKVNSWLDVKSLNPGREWAYTGIPQSLIMIEELLENKSDPSAGIEDFKFFCFNGIPFIIQYDALRQTDHRKNYYDTKWNRLDLQTDYENLDCDVQKPHNLDKMLEIAKILSKDFPHVRVDLYSIEDIIYFGEMTFYPYSGYMPLNPDDFDIKMGEKFDISSFFNPDIP